MANCNDHENAVLKVDSNPFNGKLFCSAGFDKRIDVWELEEEVFKGRF